MLAANIGVDRSVSMVQSEKSNSDCFWVGKGGRLKAGDSPYLDRLGFPGRRNRGRSEVALLTLFGLGSSHPLYPSHPFHSFARVVEERIMSEISFYGICPRSRFGAWPLPLPQNGKDGCRSYPSSARGKEPKVPNGVVVAFWDVLCPTVDEFLQRALGWSRRTTKPSAPLSPDDGVSGSFS